MREILREKVTNIMNEFYKHATGVDDYGCKECLKATDQILALIGKCGGRSKEEIEKIIAHNLSSLSLFGYWCNVYKTKEDYEKNKNNDLEVFGRYLAKGLVGKIPQLSVEEWINLLANIYDKMPDNVYGKTGQVVYLAEALATPTFSGGLSDKEMANIKRNIEKITPEAIKIVEDFRATEQKECACNKPLWSTTPNNRDCSNCGKPIPAEKKEEMKK